VRGALEAIYRRHRQGLFTLALSITGRVELAEDAVQEAFVGLWRRGAPPAGDVVAYVFAAVRNAAIDQLRKRRRSAGDSPVSIYDGAVIDPDPAAEAEQRRLLRDALEALPAEQREAVVLRIYAGLSFGQVAEMLGEPLPTVASRYRRALERIRQHMRDRP
jgi:RNA polymerase sigma-70 factor (ECF subfamily)